MDLSKQSGIWELEDEQIRVIRKQAGLFTFNLVKALLQTGYYTADHPLAKAAAAGIFSQFREVTRKTYDVTYVLASTVDETGVVIDGLTPEPIDVAKSFSGAMGEHFTKKFHDYFLRNRIAAFTIKRHIDESDFEKFMDIWVGWAAKTATRKESTTQQMSDELNQYGLLNITLISFDEVPGSLRRLPVAVQIALARLRKDLSRIPLLKDATDEAIRNMKHQVVEDILRPLRKPAMIRDLLINADLVAEGLEHVDQNEVEDTMVGLLNEHAIRTVSPLLIEFLTHLATKPDPKHYPGRDMDRFREAVDRIARKVLVNLAAAGFEDAFPVLRTAYETGLVDIDALPEALVKRIKASELFEVFQRSPDDFLNDFQRCMDRDRYIKFAEMFETMIPEMTEREEVRHLAFFLSVLQRHMVEKVPSFPDRAVHAGEILNMLVSTGSVDSLVRLTTVAPKEQRVVLENALLMFGGTPVPALLRLLEKSEDASIRKSAMSLLERVGRPSVSALATELQSQRHPWYVARNYIDVLGRIGLPEGVDVILQYTVHPKSRVREVCLIALANILGTRAGDVILPFLKDEDTMIVRRAVHFLGSIRYADPAFLDMLHEKLPPGRRDTEETDTAIITACLTTLQNFTPDLLPDTPDLETDLLALVNPSVLSRHLPTLSGIRPASMDHRLLAVKALGAIGTEKSLLVLNRLASKGPNELRDTAAGVANRIRKRPPPPVD